LAPARLRELDELRRRHGLRPLLGRRPGYRAGPPPRRTVLGGSPPPGRGGVALRGVAPGQVWETTHLGGDRFAGNVLVLPDGFLYGHVTAATAAALAAACADRPGLPGLLRGRTPGGVGCQG